MLTGDIRTQVDAIWNAFWTGGIANPLEVMEQITYLLFIRRLDELQTIEDRKAARTGKPPARRTFPEGKDPRGKPRLAKSQASTPRRNCRCWCNAAPTPRASPTRSSTARLWSAPTSITL